MSIRTRDPLRVDPLYYINVDEQKPNAFAQAIQDVGEPPCIKQKCSRVSQCAEDGVECFAFRIWVNSGSDKVWSKPKKEWKETGTLIKPCK